MQGTLLSCNGWGFILSVTSCHTDLSGCAVACFWLSLHYAESIMCIASTTEPKAHRITKFGCLSQLKLITMPWKHGELQRKAWAPKLDTNIPRIQPVERLTNMLFNQGNRATLGVVLIHWVQNINGYFCKNINWKSYSKIKYKLK